ncbi:MAG: hypothetical protein REI96_12250 [Flavobacterium nitrogenifigens]|uniref:DUF6625 family protein n=1 Tax=Flavobacterium nitrogenifigens TaxID=1617283 RepID=UPI00280703BB|nr:DUF6625 family protein [Flavobacterium nitrogenifigens]MDQ8013215.1 hypothetical protein [Flavobacterium nitrogenifigens]
MKKIGLINVFAGEAPWFFKLFLKSCQANLTVDFFIFTDILIDDPITQNVKIIPFSLADFNRLATEKLGFDIDVRKGYKLCDFRPAFGIIFSEYLAGYDFWGITDIDVIYGRIREFMSDELLEEFDVVCVRHAYITACCMLYKNSSYVNNLYLKSRDYKMVFTSFKNYAFDEANFENSDSFLEVHDIFRRDCEIESIQHVLVKEADSGNLKAHFDLLLIDGLSGKLKWDNGIFTYGGKFEFMLFHLLNYKCNIFADNHLKWNEVPDVFYIDRFGYRESNSLWVRLKVLCKDNLLPFFWNLGKMADCFISYALFRKKAGVMQAGDYYYHLSKRRISIRKCTKGANHISAGGASDIVLYRMLFSPNYFFSRDFGLIVRIPANQSAPYEKFDIVYRDGHSAAYVKSRDPGET